MDTYLIYVVEGYETFDKKTNTYTDVKRIEVITTTEKEAYEKARKLLKAKNYKVWGAYEKVMPGDFTAKEKEPIVRSYVEMAEFYRLQILALADMIKAKAKNIHENHKGM